jgi:hypothetical protein
MYLSDHPSSLAHLEYRVIYLTLHERL